MPRKIACLGLSALAFGAVAAPTDHRFGNWNSLILSGNFGAIAPDLSRWRWQILEVIRLRDDRPFGLWFSENLVFSQLGYDLTEHSSVWLGYAHDWINPPDKPAFQESRPYQDFLWVSPLADGRVTLRIRLEQRINQNTGDLGVRVRQMVQFNYPLPWLDGLGAYIGDEVLGYLNENSFGRTGFSENRIMAGLAYNFDEHFGVDLGYLGQYVSNPGKSDLFTHNLQANLRYAF